jgi:hypothetical protein
MARRLIPAALAATGLVSAMLVAAPAASATCTIDNYSPRSVVIGLSPIVKTFGVSASGCAIQGWSIDIANTFIFVYDGAPQEVFYPTDFVDSDAGYKADAVIEAYDEDYNTSTSVMLDSFVVKRNTTWGAFNASPEPVSKGKPIKITGTLRVASWSQMKYVPQKGSTVSVQFKKAGTSTWSTVKKVVTSSTYGTVSTSVNATYDGSWRLYYPGSGTRGPATSITDYVDVR